MTQKPSAFEQKVRGVEETLDEFLEGVSGVMCFPETVKVYAPTCDGKCEDAVQKLTENLTDAFGGSTTYNKATGCWFDEKKDRTLCEPVKVIEIGHRCSGKEDLSRLAKAIVGYARDTGQEAISIKNGNFFIADTPELQVAYEEVTRSAKK